MEFEIDFNFIWKIILILWGSFLSPLLISYLKKRGKFAIAREITIILNDIVDYLVENHGNDYFQYINEIIDILMERFNLKEKTAERIAKTYIIRKLKEKKLNDKELIKDILKYKRK